MKYFLGLALPLGFASASIAASIADDFGAQRWPTGPALLLNNQPALCTAILKRTTEAFSTEAVDIDIAAVTAMAYPPVTLTPFGNDGAESHGLAIARVSLDGGTRQQVLLARSFTFNWRGDWSYGYVFPTSQKFDEARSSLSQPWKEGDELQYPSPTVKPYGAQQFYPSGLMPEGKSIQTGNVWAQFQLFAFEGRVYFVEGSTKFDRYSKSVTNVYRLRPDGLVEPACAVDIPPSVKSLDDFQKLPAVGSFLTTLRRIGAGGNDCGTLQCGIEHDAQATAAERRAAARPWATSLAPRRSPNNDDHPYYIYNDRTEAFLKAWGYREIWNKREYQTLMELKGPAIESYAGYLEKAFGISPSRSRASAEQVIGWLIGSRLLIPTGFDADEAPTTFQVTPLQGSVLQRALPAFNSSIANPILGTEGTYDPLLKSPQGVLTQALPDASEWPYAFDKLLSAGADPNHGNPFGKTPLMTAAHLNRVDSVRSLLKAGAKVNAATTEEGSNGPDSIRFRRTALMYAAENAGPAVIKTLLDAGADPKARDSEDKGIDYYLSRNPRFTPEQKSAGIAEVAKLTDQFSQPGFSCTSAKRAVERTICSSEILRILDGEGARAFNQLRARYGESEVRAQRAWLRIRDTSCQNGTDADCLAEIMRTHVRALHARIAELDTAP